MDPSITYITFGDKKLDSIHPDNLERTFGLTIHNDKNEVLTFPEIEPSVCSCYQITDSTLDISSFCVIDGLAASIVKCVICRNDMSTKCIECEDNKNESCQCIRSHACDHEFHYHCIKRWLKTRNVCPLCFKDWAYEAMDNAASNILTVRFKDQNLEFGLNTSLDQICQKLKISSDKYKLCQNKKFVENSTYTASTYSLCTKDMHDTHCLELKLENTLNDTFKKIYCKISTKLKQFKKDVAESLNIMEDKIDLVVNKIRLVPEFDELNLFNINLSNESIINVIPRKVTCSIYLEENFVVLYARSSFQTEASNPIRKMVGGAVSWYPHAYYPNVTDSGISRLLSSLYVLVSTVDKNEDKIKQIVDKMKAYLIMYKMQAISLNSLMLLLRQDHNKFTDVHRTILVATFYEMIRNMKIMSGCADNRILEESNVLCDLLTNTLEPQMVNWTYSKKSVGYQKSFQVYSPIVLPNMNPPILTLDENFHSSVYISRGKDLERSITLYSPITDTEHGINPAILGEKISQKEDLLTDDRIYDECIMVCVDTSNSMGNCADFEEDKQSQKESKAHRKNTHLKIWTEASVVKLDIEQLEHMSLAESRSLRNAVSWFITHPNAPQFRSKHSSIKEIVCTEQYSNNAPIAQTISENRHLFWKLLTDIEITISGIKYNTRFDSGAKAEAYTNVPLKYLCPITHELMQQPVILDDGHTYELEAIKAHLRQKKTSPMNNIKVVGDIIPNYSIKSMIEQWKIKHCKKSDDISSNSNQEQSNKSSFNRLKIIQDHGDIINFSYTDETNIYDLAYFLYNQYEMDTSKCKLKTTSGFNPFMNTTQHVSQLGESVMLSRCENVSEIKIVCGSREIFGNSLRITVPTSFNIVNIIYMQSFMKYDRCWGYHNVEDTGDNMCEAIYISPIEKLPEKIHIFKYQHNESKFARHRQAYLTRLDVVKKLFDAFIDRSIAYGSNTCIGLMSFNNKSELVGNITPYYEGFRGKINSLVQNGSTALYDCLLNASQNLVSWKEADAKRKDTKLRIICLSDGADDNSMSSFSTTSTTVKIELLAKNNNIIIDAILIGSEYDNQLISLANRTGGYVFNPVTIKSAYDLMELETLISSIDRAGALPYRQITQDAPFMIKPHEQLNAIAVPIEKFNCSDINININIKSGSDPIQKELIHCLKNLHPDIDIYINDNNLYFWKVIVSGPSSTVYEGGCWAIYLKFSNEYPLVPPHVRMVTPIKHCNINNYGRICHSILDRNYVPSTRISTILECIYGLFLNPDTSDPLDTNLALQFYQADGQYEANIMIHTKTHANIDRNKWRQMLTTGCNSGWY